MKIRRQHYVWKKYLEPWTSEGKVWCLRQNGGDPFYTNPINVAVERDFYKLTDLTADDLTFIHEFVIKQTNNANLRKLNERWVKMFDVIFKLDKRIRNSQGINPEIVNFLDENLNNFEEKNHA